MVPAPPKTGLFVGINKAGVTKREIPPARPGAKELHQGSLRVLNAADAAEDRAVRGDQCVRIETRVETFFREGEITLKLVKS
ncbi:hypothetical protein ZWY2020_018724 [Hordeum vulgare]|nr:hypothetical protein ZWY2020_018724 [Hordeum vulgare]